MFTKNPYSLKNAAYVALSVAVAVALILSSASVIAQNLPDIIADCDGCTEQAHYAFLAAQEVPDPPPNSSATWLVYVANITQSHVEAFYVDVHPLGGGGIDPPPEHPGINSTPYEFGPYKTVWPTGGDPVVKAAVLDGITIVYDFSASLEGSIGAKDVTDTIDSAIDLVGSAGPPSLARLQLSNDLNEYYGSLWSSLFFNVGDLVGRAANQFLGSSALGNPIVRVQFEDGTSIVVKITSVHPELTGFGIFIEFEVLPHTAQLPDGSPVPQTPVQFSGYSWDDSAGGTNIGAQLALLAALYGLEVGEPGEGLDCDFECNGNHCSLSCQL